MNDLKDFIVPFSSLKNGSNHLSFDLDKEFFEAFNFSEVNNSKIMAVVDFRKESHLFDIRIKWSGSYQSICDRCLGEITIKSNESFRRIVKFSHETAPKTTSEIILISYDDGITAKKGHEGEFKNDDFHGEGTCIIYGDDGITVRQGLEGV